MAGSNPKNRVVETMCRVEMPLHGFVVRVWGKYINIEYYPIFYYEFVKCRKKKLKDLLDAQDCIPELTLEDVLKNLESQEWISAAEIVDSEGDGFCIYPDWP